MDCDASRSPQHQVSVDAGLQTCSWFFDQVIELGASDSRAFTSTASLVRLVVLREVVSIPGF